MLCAMTDESVGSGVGAPPVGSVIHDWSMSDEELLKAILEAGSHSEYARKIGCARSTLEHQLGKRKLLKASQRKLQEARMAQHQKRMGAANDEEAVSSTERIGEDEAAFYGLVVEDLADADQLLRRRGFSPDDWLVTGASITEWGRDPETGAPYQRLKVTIKRRASILGLLPASVNEIPRIPKRTPRVIKDTPETWVILSDQHAPYHDVGLHACTQAFIRDVRPDRGVLAGDTLDLPTPSRHRRNPKFSASPQQCVDAAYHMLKDYRLADPRTQWTKLLGNHDVRIRNFLLESAAHELATLRPADTGDEGDLTPIMAVSRLLHLDALGIECIEPEGEYGDEMAAVCKHLGVIHGESTAKNASEVELNRYGHSLAIGHTHKKSSLWKTSWDWDGPSTRMALGLGCMCEIQDGLGYTRRPDWAQGFGFATVWPDGRFNLEHVTYTSGSLFWRDRRWTADD